MHLTTNGKPCVSDNAFWQGMAELSGKNGPDYSTPAGPFAPGSKNITIGGWAGLVSDVRLYDGKVDAATLEKLHSATEHIYKSTEYQVPSEAEIAQLNRTWHAPELGPAQMTMYNAWLNHNVSASSLAVPSWLTRVVMGSGEHPALETAAGELRDALPGLAVARDALTALADAEALAALGGSIALGSCAELSAVLAQLPAEATARKHCERLAGEDEDEDAFALQLVTPAGAAAPVLLGVGGGVPGVLYAAFAIAEHVQLHKPWSAEAIDRAEAPT